MPSISEVGTKGQVFIPESEIRKLGIKEGDYIAWKYDPQSNRTYIQRNTVTKVSEFERMTLQSKTRTSILFALKEKPLTFTQLKTALDRVRESIQTEPHSSTKKISPRTLSDHLKKCEEEGLVSHERRNLPYKLTRRGRDLVDVADSGHFIEGNDVKVTVVEKGSLLGSLIIHVPQNLVRMFCEEGLYTPKTIEHLHQIMQVSLEFWVRRNIQAEPYVSIEHGIDFNRNGIPDLMIHEMRSGYPCIREAIKNHRFWKVGSKEYYGPLIQCAFEALEEKIAKMNKG